MMVAFFKPRQARAVDWAHELQCHRYSGLLFTRSFGWENSTHLHSRLCQAFAVWQAGVVSVELSVRPEINVSDISRLCLTQLHEVDSEGFAKNSGDRRCGLIPPGGSMPVKGPACAS